MNIIIFFMGVIVGSLLNVIINRISYRIDKEKGRNNNLNPWVLFISGGLFTILFLKIGMNIIFFKGIVLASILIIVSFVDIKHRVIPDYMVIVTVIIGAIFSFSGEISFVNSIVGMVVGGGILFLLALIPGALGGGDVKIMFGIGIFLGFNRTLWAVVLAFAFASVISIFLLVFKIKGRKDNIPFGPFLALGSCISFIVFI